jgi:hypothetical protein
VEWNLFFSDLQMTQLASLDDGIEVSLVEDIETYEKDQSMKGAID